MVDPAYVCVGLFGSTSRCTKRAACGNGILEAGERCDNGGRAGCSSKDAELMQDTHAEVQFSQIVTKQDQDAEMEWLK